MKRNPRAPYAGFVKKNTHLTSAELALELGLPKQRIRSFIHHNGVKVKRERKAWTMKDEKFLQENYDMPRWQMSLILGRSVNSIYTQYSRMHKRRKSLLKQSA